MDGSAHYLTSPEERARLADQDHLLGPLFAPLLDRFFAQHANVRTALDLGCGTGAWWPAWQGRFPGLTIHGVEQDATHAAEARARGGTVEVGDVRTLALPGDQDLVMCRLLLRHLPDPDALLDRMKQAARPGGLVLIVDSDDGAIHFHPDPKLEPPFAEVSAAVAQKLGGVDVFMGRSLTQRIEKAGLELLDLGVVTLHSGPDLKAKHLVPLFDRWFDAENNGLPPAVNEALRQRLRTWAQGPEAFVQVDLYAALARRPA